MIPKPLFDNTVTPILIDTTTAGSISKPKALFADVGFKSTDIDNNVRIASVQYGKFTDIELARITHILHHELPGLAVNEASIFQHIEKMQQATKRSDAILTTALSNTVIHDINESMRSILSIITNTDIIEKPVLYHVLNSIAKFLHDIDYTPVNPTSNEQGNEVINQIVINLTTTSIPIANKVVLQLKDAVYYAKNDRKQLQLYFVACNIKSNQYQLTIDSTANEDTSYDKIDQIHALNLFNRRIDSINSHIQAISVSIVQAQTILHTLENMLLDVSSTVLISVPSYIQQVKFISTIRELKNSTILKDFEKHRSLAINDLKQLLTTSKG